MELGTRHAHILVYIPTPTKKRISSIDADLTSSRLSFGSCGTSWSYCQRKLESEYQRARERDPWADIEITPANAAHGIYTVKDVRQADVAWSRFEFVTPPKFKKFKNENLSAIRNRDRQRRAVLARAQAQSDSTYRRFGFSIRVCFQEGSAF